LLARRAGPGTKTRLGGAARTGQPLGPGQKKDAQLAALPSRALRLGFVWQLQTLGIRTVAIPKSPAVRRSSRVEARPYGSRIPYVPPQPGAGNAFVW